MLKHRKLCLIPLFGAIIYFLIIAITLKNHKVFNAKLNAGYLILMGILGLLGVFLGMLAAYLISRIAGVELSNLPLFPFLPLFPVGVIFAWPLITLPVIDYSKKAETLISNAKNQRHE